MTQTYKLIFKNNSSRTGNACIYQTDPDIGNPNVMSLAWFSKGAHPGVRLNFSWGINYGFVWSETGELFPGINFSASQIVDADLNSKNKTTFSKDSIGYFFKEPPVPGARPGALYIVEDETIPDKLASVGIAMSGAATFAVQAGPNLQATFTPHSKYWITFGNYEQGDVLDIGEITEAAEIDFPSGVYTMVATLNEDNTWDVKPLSAVNAQFIAARKNGYAAIWGES